MAVSAWQELSAREEVVFISSIQNSDSISVLHNPTAKVVQVFVLLLTRSDEYHACLRLMISGSKRKV